MPNANWGRFNTVMLEMMTQDIRFQNLNDVKFKRCLICVPVFPNSKDINTATVKIFCIFILAFK